MTRISNEIQGNSLSALIDIFELYKYREPVEEEVNTMLMLMGNQGSLYKDRETGKDELMNFQSENFDSMSRILSSN